MQIKVRQLYHILPLLPLLFSSGVAAKNSYQTSRLHSTAGAGVGSILLEESTVLNPAPLALFTSSSIMYQRTQTSEERSTRTVKGKGDFVSISDVSGKAIKGSVAYQRSTLDIFSRNRVSLAMASMVSKESALGVTYHYTNEENSIGNGKAQHASVSQATFGVLHAPSPTVTFGLIVNDPFNVKKDDSYFIAGIQYNYQDYIHLIFDAGADYHTSLSESSILRAGIQFRIVGDIFLRAGASESKKENERATGLGVGWLAPKFNINAAYRDSRPMQETTWKTAREATLSFAFRY